MFYFVTKNDNKFIEVSKILDSYKEEYPTFNIELKKLEIDLPEDIEVFNTYYENALKKAQYVYHQVFKPVITEDSGLEIDVLLGFPGVKTSRIFPKLSQEQKNLAFSNMVSHLPMESRKCRYVCRVVVLFDFSRYYSFEGVVDGFISDQPLGDNGFGFDPIFIYPSMALTFGQMEISVKCAISHRYIAFRKLFDFLRQGKY
ncbi:MAG: non-canonical purine NTP pyrophosphatase [Candidatus Calescibacterium sp.]|nr:non-canonical purine NTP pyrophosphatase [Candidatus Calescibacterium sp.]MDW8132040.1 non-canonical purine NTP pyrophosphatase [Candidatus Calescibacterium sp.]